MAVYDALAIVNLLRVVRLSLTAGAPYSVVLERLNVPHNNGGLRLVDRARSGQDKAGEGLFLDRKTMQPCLDEGSLVLLFIRPVVVALDQNWEREKAASMVACLVQCLIQESVALLNDALIKMQPQPPHASLN